MSNSIPRAHDDAASTKSLAIWLWSLPFIYLIHMAEEFWGGGGYPAYMLRTRGVLLSPTRFLIFGAVGLALILIGVVLARRLRFAKWLIVCLSALFFANAVSHTITAVRLAEYNPGLVSGLIIFIPFGVAALLRWRKEIRTSSLASALAVGLAIQFAVSLIAASGGRQPSP